MQKRNYICVQSSVTPDNRLTYNEQAQYIAQQTKSSPYDRFKSAVKEFLISI